jgi:transcriptional regulator with XRE-family HTH domain
MKKSERISAAIKALRNKLGETHDGMARLLGTPLRTYDRWEAGDAIPRGTMLIKVLALCPDNASRSLFDSVGSITLKASREHAALSPMRRKAPGDRLRMGFRKSCMAAIEIIYESAVLGSQGADEKLRSCAIELNREAVLLAEGLLGIRHPSDVSRQQKMGELTRNRSSRRINDRSRITSGLGSSDGKPKAP